MQGVIFARVSEALRAVQRHFRWISCLDRSRDITEVKNRHIFLANQTQILKHSCSRYETFFWSEI